MSEANSTTLVEYRPIQGCPGYRVGDDGTVWSSKRRGLKGDNHPWRIMRPSTATNGYLFVTIFSPTGRILVMVHKLVLETFVCPRPEGMDCAHENGIRTDNRLPNLRWATRKDNLADRIAHGTLLTGERSPNWKLTRELAQGIATDLESGKLTRAEVAARNGVGLGLVGKVARGLSVIGPVAAKRRVDKQKHC